MLLNLFRKIILKIKIYNVNPNNTIIKNAHIAKDVLIKMLQKNIFHFEKNKIK